MHLLPGELDGVLPRQPGVVVRVEEVAHAHRLVEQGGRWGGAQRVHRIGNDRHVGDAHCELGGAEQSDPTPDLVEPVVDRLPVGLELTDEPQNPRQGSDAVLVGHPGRVTAVTDGLLVAEGETRYPTDPLEAGERRAVLLASGRCQGGQGGGGDDGVGVDAVHPATQGVVAQQGAQLVAGEHAPLPVDDGSNRAAVGVRVGGDDHVGILAAGTVQGQVQGSGLLRVGEGDGREVRVGLQLLAHPDELGKPRLFDQTTHHAGAHSVHGGVDPGDVVRHGSGQLGGP